MANKGFTHLHLHSQFSLLDGAISFDKLLKQCKKLDMDAVAVTDHGNLFGAIEFYIKGNRSPYKAHYRYRGIRFPLEISFC